MHLSTSSADIVWFINIGEKWVLEVYTPSKGKGQSFQQVEMGKLDICIEKNEFGPSSYIMYKN